jgi:hypothetical protein
MKSGDYQAYVLRLIGSLSAHRMGRELIERVGMLPLFSEMVLAAEPKDMRICLVILGNLMQAKLVLPKISLIVSCLMQELLSKVLPPEKVLIVLIQLVGLAPKNAQEYDLRKSVLPYLSATQDTKLVVLAAQLFNSCEVSQFERLYPLIIQKIVKILNTQTHFYPNVVASCARLIASLSREFDLTEFFRSAQFDVFLAGVLESKTLVKFPDVRAEIDTALAVIMDANTAKLAAEDPAPGPLGATSPTRRSRLIPQEPPSSP